MDKQGTSHTKISLVFHVFWCQTLHNSHRSKVHVRQLTWFVLGARDIPYREFDLTWCMIFEIVSTHLGSSGSATWFPIWGFMLDGYTWNRMGKLSDPKEMV